MPTPEGLVFPTPVPASQKHGFWRIAILVLIWAAAAAWPKPCLVRGIAVAKKQHVGADGTARRARGPAINAGGTDGVIQLAIKAAVAVQDG